MRIYNGLDIDTAILVYILLIFILVFIFEILFENYIEKEKLDYLICDKPLKDKVFIVIAESEKTVAKENTARNVTVKKVNETVTDLVDSHKITVLTDTAHNTFWNYLKEN